MHFLTFLFILLMVLLSVGFFTLLERSVLSYIQFRSGPNSLGLIGLVQPFSDGLKLFLKELCIPLSSNLFIYFLCPLFSLFQSLFVWILFPIYFNCIDFVYGFIFF